MFFLEANRKRYRNRRGNQRRNLLGIIAVLSVVLAVLVAVMLLPGKETGKDAKYQLHSVLTMEAGSALPPAHQFLVESAPVIPMYTDTSLVQTTVPGVYDVKLSCDGKEVTAKIQVVDTVAPTGVTQNLAAYSTKLPAPEDFVTGIQDATNVTVTYVTAPDKTKAGPQNITLLLTDAGGNTTTLSAILTLTIDEQAPVIQGVGDILVYQGDAVQYMKNVTVTDNYDTNPNVQVDRSAVDLNTPGQYQVTYTATDAAGNVSSVTVKLTVMEKGENFVPLEVVYEEVDKILDQIIQEGMSDQQKVEAIYWWIVSHCQYISHSEKDNWVQAGYRMLMERRGDCFNYFGLCKLMLERTNIPNIDVEKVPNFEGDSMHYWSLVSIDGGKNYYHVDTTPRTVQVFFCLVTDKVLDDFSAGYRNCFNRDKSLYPPTPEVGP